MRTGYKCTRIWNLFQKIQYMNFSPLTNWKLRMTEKVYVPEGTNCNSFGILRIKNEPSNINVETRTKGRKPKISFKDRNETFINLSCTGDDVVTQECLRTICIQKINNAMLLIAYMVLDLIILEVLDKQSSIFTKIQQYFNTFIT